MRSQGVPCVLVLSLLVGSAAILEGCARPTVNEGRSLYEANGCASCRGPAGHGDGPLALNLPAKPIDLRDPAQFKRGTSEDEIAETLARGISITHFMPALHHTHHMLLMPSFNHLTRAQRRSIALYLISLRSTDPGRRDHP